MKIKAITLFVVSCVLLVSCKKEEKVFRESSYKPGQVWSFETGSPNITNATFTVVRVDFDKEIGPIVYVSIQGVPHSTFEVSNFMPFSEEALSHSAISMLRDGVQLSENDSKLFDQAYEQHQTEQRSGDLSKCFTVPIAEVLKKKKEKASVPNGA